MADTTQAHGVKRHLNRDPVNQSVAGDGRVAKASKVGLESGSGSVVQERYEGRLTTARERMSTVWIERSGYTSEHTEWVSEVGEKKSRLQDGNWEAGTVWQSAVGS